ncbi:E3 ubiquitin-protein ligase lubel-like isoform X1 [Artemia franciscana]|uniref:E3 ubiquitin-protein ligase lubel-like isoform X1 n=1 Tax=Artemia franciscana TaxID=6661 RepID=UPI0032DB9758
MKEFHGKYDPPPLPKSSPPREGDYEDIDLFRRCLAAKSETKLNDPEASIKGHEMHCDLCGSSKPIVRCDKCNSQLFCLSCDDMYHRHPKRQSHLRKAIDVKKNVRSEKSNRPPLPPKCERAAPPIPPPRRKPRPPGFITPMLPRKEMNRQPDEVATPSTTRKELTLPSSVLDVSKRTINTPLSPTAQKKLNKPPSTPSLIRKEFLGKVGSLGRKIMGSVSDLRSPSTTRKSIISPPAKAGQSQFYAPKASPISILKKTPSTSVTRTDSGVSLSSYQSDESRIRAFNQPLERRGTENAPQYLGEDCASSQQSLLDFPEDVTKLTPRQRSCSVAGLWAATATPPNGKGFEMGSNFGSLGRRFNSSNSSLNGPHKPSVSSWDLQNQQIGFQPIGQAQSMAHVNCSSCNHGWNGGWDHHGHHPSVGYPMQYPWDMGMRRTPSTLSMPGRPGPEMMMPGSWHHPSHMMYPIHPGYIMPHHGTLTNPLVDARAPSPATSQRSRNSHKSHRRPASSAKWRSPESSDSDDYKSKKSSISSRQRRQGHTSEEEEVFERVATEKQRYKTSRSYEKERRADSPQPRSKSRILQSPQEDHCELQDSTETWACSHCTFMNDASDNICAICCKSRPSDEKEKRRRFRRTGERETMRSRASSVGISKPTTPEISGTSEEEDEIPVVQSNMSFKLSSKATPTVTTTRASPTAKDFNGPVRSPTDDAQNQINTATRSPPLHRLVEPVVGLISDIQKDTREDTKFSDQPLLEHEDFFSALIPSGKSTPDRRNTSFLREYLEKSLEPKEKKRTVSDSSCEELKEIFKNLKAEELAEFAEPAVPHEVTNGDYETVAQSAQKKPNTEDDDNVISSADTLRDLQSVLASEIVDEKLIGGLKNSVNFSTQTKKDENSVEVDKDFKPEILQERYNKSDSVSGKAFKPIFTEGETDLDGDLSIGRVNYVGIPSPELQDPLQGSMQISELQANNIDNNNHTTVSDPSGSLVSGVYTQQNILFQKFDNCQEDMVLNNEQLMSNDAQVENNLLESLNLRNFIQEEKRGSNIQDKENDKSDIPRRHSSEKQHNSCLGNTSTICLEENFEGINNSRIGIKKKEDEAERINSIFVSKSEQKSSEDVDYWEKEKVKMNQSLFMPKKVMTSTGTSPLPQSISTQTYEDLDIPEVLSLQRKNSFVDEEIRSSDHPSTQPLRLSRGLSFENMRGAFDIVDPITYHRGYEVKARSLSRDKSPSRGRSATPDRRYSHSRARFDPWSQVTSSSLDLRTTSNQRDRRSNAQWEETLMPWDHRMYGSNHRYKGSTGSLSSYGTDSGSHITQENRADDPSFFSSFEDVSSSAIPDYKQRRPPDLNDLLREAADQGFGPDDVRIALSQCGVNHPVEWLQNNWTSMIDKIVLKATKYGRKQVRNTVGTISRQEAVTALRRHKGDMQQAIQSCIKQRQKKYVNLANKGNFTHEDIVTSLTAAKGDLFEALNELLGLTSDTNGHCQTQDEALDPVIKLKKIKHYRNKKKYELETTENGCHDTSDTDSTRPSTSMSFASSSMKSYSSTIVPESKDFDDSTTADFEMTSYIAQPEVMMIKSDFSQSRRERCTSRPLFKKQAQATDIIDYSTEKISHEQSTDGESSSAVSYSRRSSIINVVTTTDTPTAHLAYDQERGTLVLTGQMNKHRFSRASPMDNISGTRDSKETQVVTTRTLSKTSVESEEGLENGSSADEFDFIDDSEDEIVLRRNYSPIDNRKLNVGCPIDPTLDTRHKMTEHSQKESKPQTGSVLQTDLLTKLRIENRLKIPLGLHEEISGSGIMTKPNSGKTYENELEKIEETLTQEVKDKIHSSSASVASNSESNISLKSLSENSDVSDNKHEENKGNEQDKHSLSGPTVDNPILEKHCSAGDLDLVLVIPSDEQHKLSFTPSNEVRHLDTSAGTNKRKKSSNILKAHNIAAENVLSAQDISAENILTALDISADNQPASSQSVPVRKNSNGNSSLKSVLDSKNSSKEVFIPAEAVDINYSFEKENTTLKLVNSVSDELLNRVPQISSQKVEELNGVIKDSREIEFSNTVYDSVQGPNRNTIKDLDMSPNSEIENQNILEVQNRNEEKSGSDSVPSLNMFFNQQSHCFSKSQSLNVSSRELSKSPVNENTDNSAIEELPNDSNSQVVPDLIEYQEAMTTEGNILIIPLNNPYVSLPSFVQSGSSSIEVKSISEEFNEGQFKPRSLHMEEENSTESKVNQTLSVTDKNRTSLVNPLDILQLQRDEKKSETILTSLTDKGLISVSPLSMTETNLTKEIENNYLDNVEELSKDTHNENSHSDGEINVGGSPKKENIAPILEEDSELILEPVNPGEFDSADQVEIVSVNDNLGFIRLKTSAVRLLSSRLSKIMSSEGEIYHPGILSLDEAVSIEPFLESEIPSSSQVVQEEDVIMLDNPAHHVESDGFNHKVIHGVEADGLEEGSLLSKDGEGSIPTNASKNRSDAVKELEIALQITRGVLKEAQNAFNDAASTPSSSLGDTPLQIYLTEETNPTIDKDSNASKPSSSAQIHDVQRKINVTPPKISPILEETMQNLVASSRSPSKSPPLRKVERAKDGTSLLWRLIEENRVPNMEKAQLAANLVDLKFEEEEAVEAAIECTSIYSALTYLRQECELCATKYPAKKMISMLNCTHRCCRYCAAAYFSTQIRDRPLNELVCPFCHEPSFEDGEEEAYEYFTHLEIMLKDLLETPVFELYERKMRDWTLSKDPNFWWCHKCSSGFFIDPSQSRHICPDCSAVTCAGCRKPWRVEHDNMTCEAYVEFLAKEDTESLDTVAKLLAEGVKCPKCSLQYALARGGCMHFTCTQCKFEFCSGCGKPFKMGARCTVGPRCARLGLHAHHPRNCLFYLRDKEPEDLQKLLKQHDVLFDVDGPVYDNPNTIRRCKVQIQKETPRGFEDDVCGGEILEGFAGLCRTHYVEYLAGLVARFRVDPLPILDSSELMAELRRACLDAPEREPGEPDRSFYSKVAQVIRQEIPL